LTFLIYHIVICSILASSEDGKCRMANWWKSFNKSGYSQCDKNTDFIRGFFRNNRRKGNKDTIRLLEEAKCCGRSSQWWNKETVTVYEDWWKLFNKKKKWSLPGRLLLAGFLQKLKKKNHGVSNIEEGRCSKPAGHPEHYGHCYNEDIVSCFDKKGLCQCGENYFVTGLYKGNCDNLHCIEMLRCCKMANFKEPNELSMVKTLVMEQTLYNMANLAHYLGFGWCYGCSHRKVGENFIRRGDVWEADTKTRCRGYRNKKRLSLVYADWKPHIYKMTYGKPVLDYLQPETADSGKTVNDHSTPLTTVVEREIRSIRSVTHTKSKSWKKAHELGVKLTYTATAKTPFAESSASAEFSYRFTYENSRSTTDTTNKQDEKLFRKSSSKVLDPYTAVEWEVLVSKLRVTTPYTATVLLKCSTKLRGFLRWGGGYNGRTTNYHYKQRGSRKKINFDYKFGDADTSFWEALHKQSRDNYRPWEWINMKQRWTYAGTVIDKLTKEKNYQFTLRGKFEDVQGYKVEIRWKNPKRRRKMPMRVIDGDYSFNTKNISFVARALSDDPPAPNPAAPLEDILE